MPGELFQRRLVVLNDRPPNHEGDCVIYWMQRSQRASDNPALSFAVELANELSKPVLVYFGLYDQYPMASRRAFAFMLEGLGETARALADRGVGFLLRREHPARGIVEAAREFNACAVVVDEDYLNIGRSWRASAAEGLNVKLVQVDSETVVPARISDHEEWGAYTLRPKLLKVLEDYLIDSPDPQPMVRWTKELDSLDLARTHGLLSSLDVDQDVPTTPYFTGGETATRERVGAFIETGLPRYADDRNDIGLAVSSELSPYLHFGQIASKRVALIIRDSDAPDAPVDAFLEQLIVRRELAINFCLYNPCYAELDAAPDWAARSLQAHLSDPRPELYSLEELESAATHDDLWNASQTELVRYGKIHPYMRMVWAKKMLEWSSTPEEALSRAIYMNDKYAIDGRDPNGYANIAWCILGKHDRPFAERPIFGKVRFMSTAATKRKTHWQDYISRVENLALPSEPPQ